MTKDKRTDTLTELIHSLEINEKRYFKLFIANSSGHKNYQKLFAAIDSNKADNKKELQRLASETGMNLSYEKNYLQKIIMRALRNFHEEATPEIALHQGLVDVEILFNKQQYELCKILLKTFMTIAEGNEQFTVMLQVLKWQRRLMIRKGQYREISELNPSLTAKEMDCLQKLENLAIYKDIQAQMLGQLAKKGIAREKDEMKEMEEIMRNPYLQNESKALSYHAKILFYESRNWYFQYTLQLEKAYETSKETVSFIERYPEKIRLHPQSYMVVLTSFVNRCTNLSRYDEGLQVIEKMERIPEIKGIKVSKSLRTEILFFSVERRLMIYGFNRNFKKGIDFYEKNKAEIEKNRKAIRPAFFSLSHLLVAMCHLHLNQPENALKHLRILFDEADDSQRLDTFMHGHMLHIMTHFELKNYELLPYLCSQAKRFAKSRNFQQKTVSIFLKMFTELSKNNSKADIKRIVSNYKPQFEELNKLNADSVLQGTIDLDYWMLKKLQ